MNFHRRHILTSTALLAVSGSFGLRAQTPKPNKTIAYLGRHSLEQEASRLDGLITGLAALGWNSGANLKIELGWARGDAKQYPAIAGELMAHVPAVIVTGDDLIAKSILPVTLATPVVFAVGFDPLGYGIVKSLASPGGNVTGISLQTRELSPKRLGLLKEAVAALKIVGAFHRAGDANALQWLDTTREQAKRLGVQVIGAPISSIEDIAVQFDLLAKQRAGAILNIPDSLFSQARRQLAELALKHRMASIGGVPEFADAGALLSYAPNPVAAHRRAASLVAKILEGGHPRNLPVEQIELFEMVVNLRTAKALGIKMPQSMLLQATRVIE